MRLIFAGTSEFACFSLKALIKSGYEIPFVLTKMDQLGGRGMKLIQNPIKRLASDLGIRVIQSNCLRKTTEFPSHNVSKIHYNLTEAKPDVIVVVAYGIILPEWVLSLPHFFCINLHPSLLPRWRGAAPIQRAIESGDKETGVTVIRMNNEIDSGEILLQRTVPILSHYNSGMLHDLLAKEGSLAVLHTLKALSKGNFLSKSQSNDQATYARKIEKSESILDCSKDSETLSRRIRAFNPVPGNKIILPGLSEPVKVWEAKSLDEKTNLFPGSIQRVSSFGIDIATGKGLLRLLELQKAGGKPQKVKEFIQGWRYSSSI